MADFTTFKEDHPIVRDVPIASSAEGTEKIADIFGKVATSGVQVANQISKEYSDALVLHDSNRIIEVTNQAKVEMALQPNNAGFIAKRANDSVNSILSTVDSSLKEKVRKTSEVHLGSVNIEAAKHVYRQNNIKLNQSYEMELPEGLESLKRTVDPEQFEVAAKNLLKPAQDLTMAGIMTPHRFANLMGAVQAIQKNHEALHRQLDKGATAQQYSKANNLSFNGDETGLADRPTDPAHDYVQDHNEVEKNYSHAITQADRGIVDVQSFIDLTPDQIEVVSARLSGAATAKSYLQVDSPYDFIVNRTKELEANPSKTHEEEAELNNYKAWENSLKNGDSQRLRLETVRGAKDYRNYVARRSAAENIVYNAPDDKQAAAMKQTYINKIDSDYIDTQIAQDDAKGMPANYRNYLPQQKMIPIQGAFNPGADVMPAINSIYSLPKNQQYWATSPLKDPVQKSAVWAVAGRRMQMPDGQGPDGWSVRVMRAAQTIPADIAKSFQLGKNGERESDIRLEVQSNLQNTINYMSNIPEGNSKTSGEWIGGSVQLGVNYVKNRMLEDGDLTGSKYKQYAKEFSDGYNANYRVYSGLNSSYNLNEVNYSTDQLDALTYYKLNQFRQDLIEKKGAYQAGLSEDLLHVQVVNTRDGEVAVVSPDGTILNHERISPSLLSAAKVAWQKNESAITKEIQQKSNLFSEQYGDIDSSGRSIPKTFRSDVSSKK